MTDCSAIERSRSRALLLAAVCLLLLPAWGCKDAAQTAQELVVPKVTVADVTEQEIVDNDEYIGKTEASEIVEIRARVFGYLKTIDFKDGDRVTKDQLLFTIEPEEYEAIHEQSLSRIKLNDAKLELAKAKLARDKKLVAGGAVSQEEYEESVAAVKEVEAAIAAAKADANRTAIDLKYTKILAPLDGRIDRALVSEGNLLTGGAGSGTLLTKIVQDQPMYVYFDVDERSLLRYLDMRPKASDTKAPGSLLDLSIPCFVQLADEKDFPHEGLLDFVESEVNPTTGTARIRGTFKNQDRELASGLFVRVRVPIGKPYQAMLVPERSLATDQNLKFVYVLGSDGTAQRRNVELGGQRGDLRVVKSGVKTGERVIVKGLQRVKPGQKVEAEAEVATAAETVAQVNSQPAQER